jgi:hypothetical protein
MFASASATRTAAGRHVLWSLMATVAGFVLAGLLVKHESPRSTLGQKRALEFAAREYYDG